MKTLRTSLLILWLCLLPAGLQASEDLMILEDGTAVKILFFEPKIHDDKTRLALLISGETSNTFMARAQFWLGKELVDRGWAIAVPIAPDRTGFGGDNAHLLPELVSMLRSQHHLGSQKPLLVGISSGGSIALTIAAHYPADFSGVVAAPGRLHDVSEIQPLMGLPIYLRIGEKDEFRWNRQLENIVERLQTAGGIVDAAIVPEARHIFQLDWDNLEAWLKHSQ